MRRHIVVALVVSVVAVPVICTAAETAPAAEPAVPATALLNAITALADQHLRSTAVALQAVAASQEARSGEWLKMRPLLRRVEQHGTPAAVWFVRPDGSYFTVDQGLTGGNLTDRPYFPRLMDGHTIMGDLVVSRSTGRNAAIVAVPVRERGQVIGGVGASIYLDVLSEEMTDALELPETMLFFALDAEGRTALHSKAERIFLEPAHLESPTLATAVAEILGQPQGVVHYDFRGRSFTTLFRTSALTNWKVAVALSEEK